MGGGRPIVLIIVIIALIQFARDDFVELGLHERLEFSHLVRVCCCSCSSCCRCCCYCYLLNPWLLVVLILAT